MGERRELPILFTGEMVRAILDGRKTVTRRVVKPQPRPCPGYEYATAFNPDPAYSRDPGATFHGRRAEPDGWWFADAAGPRKFYRCPYGKPGDLLWVKEAIAATEGRNGAFYVADGTPTVADAWPWKRDKLPGMFMPRGLVRIWLRVTDVRVERVQEITEVDAKAEGVTLGPVAATVNGAPGEALPGSHRTAFRWLWDRINAKRGYPWADNPWVWVVRFEVDEVRDV